jgi:TonB-dependent starch-binding outer membrane protein SusC
LQKRLHTGSIKSVLLSILFCLQGVVSYSQEKISGYITDRDEKLPLYPVSIIVKGTAVGTLTDSTGYFKILAKKGSTLIFSFVGHASLEVTIGNETDLRISLLNSVSNLNEVVMTGYMSQVVKEITGSVTVIKGNTLTAEPVGMVDEMLQGKASGLTVISSGEPGGASVIRINGIGNFGDVTPLYIIDGVQGDINALNPYDIESMQVLKDAGAYSIYGVRAANGVIIVTTRKGKSGKSVINFESYVGYQVPLKKGLDLANPQGQADLLWLAEKNSGIVDPVTGNPTYPLYGSGPVPVLPDYVANGNGYMAGAPEVDPSLNNIVPGAPIYQIMKFNKTGTDWYHEVFKPAWNQNYSVSASGGNDKNHYLFSLGYLNQQGTFLATYLKKFTVRVNTDFNIDNTFRIGENLQLNQNQSPLGKPTDILDPILTDPWLPIYDIKGHYSSENGQNAGPADNIVASRNLTKDDANTTWEILGNAYAELDFLKYFTLRSSFGGTFNFNNNYYYNYSAYDPSLGLNKFTENTGYADSWTWTNTLTFSEIFKQKHHLKVLVGTENISAYSRMQSGTSEGYLSDNPNIRFLGNGNGIPSDQTVNSSASSTFLSSFIGALEYGFEEKYFFRATIREDASSVFSPETRYGWFPSFSAAWRITRESFMNNISWLTELKIRGSWGISGYNGNTNPLNQYTLYGSGPGASFYDLLGTSNSSVSGLSMVQIGNAKTGWQQDYMTDLGFDAVLGQGKFTLSGDVYNKQSDGLLFPVLLPTILGFATPPNVNIGKIQNRGINLTLGMKGNFSKDFSWNFNIAFTSFQTKVLQLNGVSYFDNANTNSQYGPLVRNEVGYPIGSFFGYKIIGFFQDSSDVAKSPVQEAAAPGRFKYLDANHDGKIDVSDRVHFGNPNPRFTAGITIGFSFKRFDFSTFSYWSCGNDLMNIPRIGMDIFAGLYHTVKSVIALNDSWTPTHKDARAPIVEDLQNFSNDGVVNSYSLEKGSYFRNKTMILGYTLPAGSLEKFRISRFRAYAEVVNLFTITKYSGLDPEISGTNSALGVDFGNYPNNQLQYVLGINLNF